MDNEALDRYTRRVLENFLGNTVHGDPDGTLRREFEAAVDAHERPNDITDYDARIEIASKLAGMNGNGVHYPVEGKTVEEIQALCARIEDF